MATKSVSMPTTHSRQKRLGRPNNVYTLAPTEWRVKWDMLEKFEDLNTLLEAFPEGGFAAYASTKPDKALGLSRPLARVTFAPAGPSREVFWVRAETPDEEVDFSIPAPIHFNDIPKLLEQWEMDMEVLTWVPAHMGSVCFPIDWTIPRKYVVSPIVFWVLVWNPKTRETRLISRAGMHSIRTPEMQIAGILGPVNDLSIPMAIGTCNIVCPTPLKLDTMLTPPQIRALRLASSRYFVNRIMTKAPGCGYPVWPIVHTFGEMPPAGSITEFTP